MHAALLEAARWKLDPFAAGRVAIVTGELRMQFGRAVFELGMRQRRPFIGWNFALERVTDGR